MKVDDSKIFELSSGKQAYENLLRYSCGKEMQAYYNVVRDSIRRYYDGYKDAVNSFMLNGRNYYYADFWDYSKFGINFSQAKRATYAVFLDYPLAYYVYEYFVSGNEQRNLSMYCIGEEFKTANERKKDSEIITRNIKVILDQISESWTEEKKAKYIYDLLTGKCTYNQEMSSVNYVDITSHSVLGVLRDKKAVCEGFAKTYQALMNLLGIPCLYLSGVVYNDAKNPAAHSGAHAYNAVLINKKWRLVDVTDGTFGNNGFCNSQYEKMYREIPEKERNMEAFQFMLPHPFYS